MRMEEPLTRLDVLRELFNTVSERYYNTMVGHLTYRSRFFWVESIGEYGNSRVRLQALVYRRPNREVEIWYQRFENMDRNERIHFIAPLADQDEVADEVVP